MYDNARLACCSWRVLALVQFIQWSLLASQQSHWQAVFVTPSQAPSCAVHQSSEDPRQSL